jgi:uncharacterized protein (TIGR03437 family)
VESSHAFRGAFVALLCCAVPCTAQQFQWDSRIITSDPAVKLTGSLNASSGNIYITATYADAVFTGNFKFTLPASLQSQTPCTLPNAYSCVQSANATLQLLEARWDVKVAGYSELKAMSAVSGPNCDMGTPALTPYTSGNNLGTPEQTCKIDRLYRNTIYGRWETNTGFKSWVSFVRQSGSFASYNFSIPMVEVYKQGTGPTPTTADLGIARIIPVQVVHTFPNPPAGVITPLPKYESEDLPLIAGKPTVVRAFIKSLGTNPQAVDGVTAILRGYPSSGFTPSEPNPLKPFTQPIKALPYTGPMPPTDAPDFTEATVDFRIPQDWWTTEGTYTLEVELVLPKNFQDADSSNNKKTHQIVFWKQPAAFDNLDGRFGVGYVSVCHQPPGAAAPLCPNPNLAGLGRFVQLLYPVAPATFDFFRAGTTRGAYQAAITSPAGMIQALRRLRVLYDRLDQRTDREIDELIIFLPNTPGIPWGGLSDVLWDGNGLGRVALVTDYSQLVPPLADFSAYNVAHELGHLLGLRHPNQFDPPACIRVAPDDCTRWPYANPRVQTEGYYEPGGYVTSRRNYDLMSYCVNNNATNLWVSPYTYWTLYDNDLAPSLSPPKPGTCGTPAAAGPIRAALEEAAAWTPQPRTATPKEYVLISGTAKRDGSAGTLEPAFRISTRHTPPPSDPVGNHCIRFFGAAGALGDHCFTLGFVTADSQKLEEETFTVMVTPPDGTTRVALLQGSRELASLAGGAQPPTVAITAPKAGDTWAGGLKELSWTGAGSGPAPLTYIVDYSSDGGTNWSPLGFDTRESSLSIDPTQIDGGSRVWFRVQASDGWRTSTAQAGPIMVLQTSQIDASPASLDFRNGLPGGGVVRQVTLSNSGTGPLLVNEIRFSDTAFRSTSPHVPFTVPAAGSITVEVQFTPPASGAKQGTMTVLSNAGNSPSLSIPLVGNGLADTAADPVLTPANVDFGRVPQGGSKTAQVTLQNFGPAPLRITSAALTGNGFTTADTAAGVVLGASDSMVFTLQFVPSQLGSQTGNLALQTDDPAHPSLSVPLRAEGVAPGVANPLPRVASGGVTNAASYQNLLSRGAVATVFGADLSGSTGGAPSVPLPRALGGTRVMVSGVDAPLFYVSPTQINFQVPFETVNGTVEVKVIRDGVSSTAESVTVQDYAPGVFTYVRAVGVQDPIVVYTDNSLVTPSRPANPSDVLVIYATGIGLLDYAPATGAATQSSPLAAPVTQPVITLDGNPIEVLWAGLTPGSVGLAQLNVRLPSTLAQGPSLPLVVKFGSVSSPAVQLPVRGSGQPSAAPAIAVSPASLDFASVTTGQTKDLTLTVRNNGNATLTVTSATTSSTLFLVTAPVLPFSVPAGGTQAITIRFAPVAVGAQSATLTIASDDPASPRITVSLAGSGSSTQPPQGPQISAEPAFLDFGSIPVGQKKDLSFNIRNTGSSTLTINALNLAAGAFTLTAPATPFTIAAGAQQNIPVRYAPTQAGGETTALLILSNDPSSPVILVRLTGATSASVRTASR